MLTTYIKGVGITKLVSTPLQNIQEVNTVTRKNLAKSYKNNYYNEVIQ